MIPSNLLHTIVFICMSTRKQHRAGKAGKQNSSLYADITIAVLGYEKRPYCCTVMSFYFIIKLLLQLQPYFSVNLTTLLVLRLPGFRYISDLIFCSMMFLLKSRVRQGVLTCFFFYGFH